MAWHCSAWSFSPSDPALCWGSALSGTGSFSATCLISVLTFSLAMLCSARPCIPSVAVLCWCSAPSETCLSIACSFSNFILFFACSTQLVIVCWLSLLFSPLFISCIRVSMAMLFSISILCFFLLGWLGCLSVLLVLCLSFLIFLIFSSNSCSFLSSSSTSCLFSLVSFSPSFVPSLGRAHLLYSLREFRMLWPLLLAWIMTASCTCLSYALL